MPTAACGTCLEKYPFPSGPRGTTSDAFGSPGPCSSTPTVRERGAQTRKCTLPSGKTSAPTGSRLAMDSAVGFALKLDLDLFLARLEPAFSARTPVMCD